MYFVDYCYHLLPARSATPTMLYIAIYFRYYIHYDHKMVQISDITLLQNTIAVFPIHFIKYQGWIFSSVKVWLAYLFDDLTDSLNVEGKVTCKMRVLWDSNLKYTSWMRQKLAGLMRQFQIKLVYYQLLFSLLCTLNWKRFNSISLEI